MRRAKLEEQLKALDTETAALRVENLTLKDTILILTRQLSQERLEKQIYLKTIIQLQKQTAELKNSQTEGDGLTLPSTSSKTLPLTEGQKLKRTLSRECLPVTFEDEETSASAVKYHLTKKQSTKSYPMEVTRRMTMRETPSGQSMQSHPSLHRLKTLKQLRKEEMMSERPSLSKEDLPIMPEQEVENS